jgi:hypothetical protein
MNLLGMKRKLLPLGSPQGGGKGGGGGGGGQQPAPASQTVTQTAIPEYARPYVESMLGKSEALTDINQNPYQSYGGQRIAGFNPVQERAFQNVQNMQTAPQLNQGTALAGASGLGALGAGANYQAMATNPNATAAYMSPYMQNVVDVQKDEAFRDAQIRNLGSNLGSARQGTYGGARQLLGEQERNRNLQTQLGQIQASGSQRAFDAAQQAQQFGTSAGLQGFGQAGQAASTLGNLGQLQYGQQQGINQAQQQVGAIQQAQAQQGLDLGYQDFLKQRNYPYQQLAFQSDMLRGIPLSQSAQQIYTAPPSTASQLGGLGMSALGIYGMSGGFKAEGGMVGKGHAEGGLMAAKAYKEGGLTYASGGDISTMSTEELTEMLNNPSINPLLAAEIEKLLMLHRRMAMNPETDQIMAPALGRAGIASIGTGDMVPDEMAAGAGGGIVAFADRGVVNLKDPKLSDNTAERRKMLQERESAMFKRLFEDQDPFKESKSSEAELRASLAESTRMNPYAALTTAGFKMLQGSSDPSKRGNILSELGEAGEAGLGTYAKGKASQAEMNRALLGQIEKREASKFGRDVALQNALTTSLGQMDAKELGAMNARSNQALAASTRDSNLRLKYASLYKDTLDDVKEKMLKQDKFGQLYRKDPAGFNRAAELETKRILPKEALEILGKTMAVDETPVANPAPGGKKPAPAVPISYPVPTADAINALKSRKDIDVAKQQFDTIFGPGAASKILGK